MPLRFLMIVYVLVVLIVMCIGGIVFTLAPPGQSASGNDIKGAVDSVAAAVSVEPAVTSVFLETQPVLATPVTFAEKLAATAETRCHLSITYDGSYQRIAYPGGDVAADRGVCSDVVVRSYRALGIDLQQRVHEDMRVFFSAYPQIWGLSGPDSNIDHRRVPNLMRYFKRHGSELSTSTDVDDYQAGDIVAWNLSDSGTLTHIGIVSRLRHRDTSGLLVVHNIGAGPQLEDCLFSWKIIGHYRFDDS